MSPRCFGFGSSLRGCYDVQHYSDEVVRDSQPRCADKYCFHCGVAEGRSNNAFEGTMSDERLHHLQEERCSIGAKVQMIERGGYKEERRFQDEAVMKSPRRCCPVSWQITRRMCADAIRSCDPSEPR